MRTYILLFLFISCYPSCNAQKNDSIPLGAKFGSYNEEISELYQMINIEHYQFHLPLAHVKDKKITFTYVEYKDSVFSEEKKLFRNGLEMDKALGKDSLYTFKVSAIKKDKKVDLWFRFPFFGLSILAPEIDTSVGSRYSLRDFITTIGDKQSFIPRGKKVPFLTYSLPYEQDGMLYYCSIMGEGSEPEMWAELYGIPHYFIFYIQIE